MQIIEYEAFRLLERMAEYYDTSCPELPDRTTDLSYSTERVRYDYIMDYLGAESLRTVFLAAAAQYLYPDSYTAVERAEHPGVHMMFGLKMESETDRWTGPEKKGGFELLTEYLKTGKQTENFLYTELYADERLMLYLMGDDTPPEQIRDFVTLHFPDDEAEPVTSPYQKQVLSQMLAVQKSGQTYLYQICGEEGRGKRRVLRAVAYEMGNGWIFVNYNAMKKLGKKEYEEAFWLICREAAFYGFGICFYHFSWEKQEELDRFIRRWKGIRHPLAWPVCVCTEAKQELPAMLDSPVCRFVMPECSRQERIAIWESMSQERGIALDAIKYGSRYRLNPGDIRKIFDGLAAGNVEEMAEEERELRIAQLIQSIRRSPQKGSLKPLDSGYTGIDLKIDEKQRTTLENICSHVIYSHKVYDIWEMERKFAYGKAVTALFCGPPGTGKSMAARVLSNELKLSLYRIDLSQVVDKYIGETEKRLEEIFTYAQNSNVILFFDEADAIFGKRTEVKDAKDKYANTEISYILQRIEDYDGIVLLATNLRTNIDEAFMRRMRYVVEFKMPDKQTRKEIWKDCLEGKMQLMDIDFDYLAEKIELSGGYIKNIILNALFLAAKEGNRISMKHILESTVSEYRKLGKVITSRDFEKYAYVFTE